MTPSVERWKEGIKAEVRNMEGVKNLLDNARESTRKVLKLIENRGFSLLGYVIVPEKKLGGLIRENCAHPLVYKKGEENVLVLGGENFSGLWQAEVLCLYWEGKRGGVSLSPSVLAKGEGKNIEVWVRFPGEEKATCIPREKDTALILATIQREGEEESDWLMLPSDADSADFLFDKDRWSFLESSLSKAIFRGEIY